MRAHTPSHRGACVKVIKDCLEAYGRGEPPPITARGCARAVRMIHDSYALAERSSRPAGVPAI